MKTSPYTKWIQLSGLNQQTQIITALTPLPTGSIEATSESITYQVGDIIDTDEWKDSVGPPSNGEEFDHSYSIDIPYNKIKDDEGNLIELVTLVANCAVNHTVEDWGYVDTASKRIIDLTSTKEFPGIYDGHAQWFNTGNVPCISGEKLELTVHGENITMPDEQYNKFVCEGNYCIKVTEVGSVKCPACESSCALVGGTPEDGAPLPTPQPTLLMSKTESSLNLTESSLNLTTWQNQAFETSSAATSITAKTDEYRMLWGFNFGILRGLGGALSGGVQLYSEELSSALATPTALEFGHPLNATLQLPEEGLVPRARLEIIQGARIIAFRYYEDGSITPIGEETAGGGKATLLEYDG